MYAIIHNSNSCWYKCFTRQEGDSLTYGKKIYSIWHASCYITVFWQLNMYMWATVSLSCSSHILSGSSKQTSWWAATFCSCSSYLLTGSWQPFWWASVSHSHLLCFWCLVTQVGSSSVSLLETQREMMKPGNEAYFNLGIFNFEICWRLLIMCWHRRSMMSTLNKHMEWDSNHQPDALWINSCLHLHLLHTSVNKW